MVSQDIRYILNSASDFEDSDLSLTDMAIESGISLILSGPRAMSHYMDLHIHRPQQVAPGVPLVTDATWQCLWKTLKGRSCGLLTGSHPGCTCHLGWATRHGIRMPHPDTKLWVGCRYNVTWHGASCPHAQVQPYYGNNSICSFSWHWAMRTATYMLRWLDMGIVSRLCGVYLVYSTGS